MIDAIDHVVLTSSNLENTLNFYCKVLGMKLKKELIKEDGSIRYSLHFGNNKININNDASEEDDDDEHDNQQLHHKLSSFDRNATNSSILKTIKGKK